MEPCHALLDCFARRYPPPRFRWSAALPCPVEQALAGVQHGGQTQERDEIASRLSGGELFEELGVAVDPTDPDAMAQSGPRCFVSPTPPGRMEYEAFSQSAGERSFYRIELFKVDPADAVDHVGSSADNRWVSEVEIEAGRCGDGKAVSDTMRLHWCWLRRREQALPAVHRADG